MTWHKTITTTTAYPHDAVDARRAFYLARRRELDAVIRQTRERAARTTQAAGLWELERWLTERRHRFDRTFEFRYSVLPVVLASLLRDGHLTEDDLHGLAPKKLRAICHMASF